MSLTRSFFNEFRPLFRMLEEPLVSSRRSRDMIFPSPFRSFLGSQDLFRSAPSLELHEQDNSYVLETELPGYKKEDVDIRIGDEGQSITISGRSFRRGRFGASAEQPVAETAVDKVSTEPANTEAGQSLTIADTSDNTSLQPAAADSEAYSTFQRTVWLPQPTNRDGSDVSAQMADGILTLTIPKAIQQPANEGVKVTIQ